MAPTVRCCMSPSQEFPQRIVCLTEETTETLYLLGEDWRIVGYLRLHGTSAAGAP